MAKRMSKIHRKFQYVVEGTGSFPLDMLRYDSSYPSSSEAVTAMDEPVPTVSPEGRLVRKPRQVTLRSDREPTVGRWESFGWRVVRSEGIA